MRPTRERIDNAVQELIDLVRAVRSMDQLMAEEAKGWQPSKFTRHQWETFARAVLAADARWRHEHPEEDA